MNRARFGAIRRTYLCALALTLSAASLSAQVVEKGRTLSDLIASHPCDTGLENRIARVTDCDSATDFGDGGGAFNCWAYCDGSAPWTNLSIGGGAGGGAATSVQGSATLPATCTEKDLYQDTDSGGTEFYVCTSANVWTKTGTGAGTIGGTLTATDDLLICTDGTGGSTIGACTVGNLDNLRLDGNTLSTTNTNGNLVLDPNGTGQVNFNNGSSTLASVHVGDAGGLYRYSASTVGLSVDGFGSVGRFGAGYWYLEGSILQSYGRRVTTSTDGSGAPRVASAVDSANVLTNEGSTAANYHTLPTAASGVFLTFCVQDADGMRIVAGASDTIRVIDKVTAAAGYIESTTIGSCVQLTALNAVEWFANQIHGTWTDGTFTYDDTSLTTP